MLIKENSLVTGYFTVQILAFSMIGGASLTGVAQYLLTVINLTSNNAENDGGKSGSGGDRLEWKLSCLSCRIIKPNYIAFMAI